LLLKVEHEESRACKELPRLAHCTGVQEDARGREPNGSVAAWTLHLTGLVARPGAVSVPDDEHLGGWMLTR